MIDNAALASSLARLWPHREHEAGVLRALCCRLGCHQWRQLELGALARGRTIDFCFGCNKVRIDGVVYEP